MSNRTQIELDLDDELLVNILERCCLNGGDSLLEDFNHYRAIGVDKYEAFSLAFISRHVEQSLQITIDEWDEQKND